MVSSGSLEVGDEEGVVVLGEPAHAPADHDSPVGEERGCLGGVDQLAHLVVVADELGDHHGRVVGPDEIAHQRGPGGREQDLVAAAEHVHRGHARHLSRRPLAEQSGQHVGHPAGRSHAAW